MSVETNPWRTISVPTAPNFFTTKAVAGALKHKFLWVVDQAGRKGLAITFDETVDHTVSFQQLENIEINLQPDKKNLTIFLENEDVLRQFRVFCDDCVQALETQAAPNNASVLITLGDTIERWVELLRDRKEGLSLQKQLGIIGELLLFRDLLIKAFTPSDCVKAWNGPNGHEQDFLLNGKLIEVKCQLSSRDKVVKIASLEQLDCISGQIYLAHIGVSIAGPGIVGSFTIPSIVDEIICLLAGDNYSIDCFLGKLEIIGYYHMKTDCAENYVKSYNQIYRIDEDFPCLVRGKTPPAIENCRYKLNLANLTHWEISESTILGEISECPT